MIKLSKQSTEKFYFLTLNSIFFRFTDSQNDNKTLFEAACKLPAPFAKFMPPRNYATHCMTRATSPLRLAGRWVDEGGGDGGDVVTWGVGMHCRKDGLNNVLL